MAVNAPPSISSERSEISDVTPLFSKTNDEVQTRLVEEEDDDTIFPFNQIALLCYCRMVEPVAFFSIFPFINEMIRETGIDQADVGFYSGWESLFSLTQMCLMIFYGKAADKYGRKPILVISLSGIAVCTCLFGLSKTVWQMILFRCMAGMFAGSIITVRAMISENSTPKTQATAFACFAFTAFLGGFLGPLAGGLLCNPADQYPAIFGKIQVLIDYPYALPTFAVGLFGASAAVLAALFVEETLDKKAGGKPSAISDDVKMSTWELIKFPGVAIVLYIYSHTMMLAFAITTVLPLFWFTAPELGGFGFEPGQISLFLGITGLSQALFTLLVFPPLQHRFGTKGVLRLCTIVWPCVFVVWSFCNILMQYRWMVAFWIVAPINAVIGGSVSMSFTSVQLALNDISPSHHTLGLISAVSLVLTSAVRAFSPAFFTNVYAVGVSEQVLGGHLVWLVMIVLDLILAVSVIYLPKRAEGIIRHDDRED